MTDTSASADRTGSDAIPPAGVERLPSFLVDGHVGQVGERDFRLGRVLAQTFPILRRHAVPFLLLYAIASLLLNVPVTFTDDDSPVANVVVAMVVAQALWLVFNAFAGAAVVGAAIDDMRSRPVDLAKSSRAALRRFFPILAVTIVVVALAVLGFVVIAFLTAMIISSYFVVVPACLVEGLGPMQSLRRSAELTRGHRWRIFALWFSTLVLEIVVQMALDQAMRPLGSFALVLAPQVAWDAVVGAFAAVLMAVTYRDLRIVKEGIEPDQIVTVFD